MIPKWKMIKNYEKHITTLKNRIEFLEGEEYGKPLYDMGFRAGVEHQKKQSENIQK